MGWLDVAPRPSSRRNDNRVTWNPAGRSERFSEFPDARSDADEHTHQPRRITACRQCDSENNAFFGRSLNQSAAAKEAEGEVSSHG